ncbi:MAG: hypothetical protein QM756_41110 [Polyangiaceae bacterium]
MHTKFQFERQNNVVDALRWAFALGSLAVPLACAPTATPSSAVAASAVQAPPAAGPESGEANALVGNLVQRLIRERGVQVAYSSKLSCAGSEAARYIADHGTYPQQGVANYWVSRCGSVSSRVHLSGVVGRAPEAFPEIALLEGAQEEIRAALDGAWLGGRSVVGVGYARQDGHFAIAIYSAEPAREQRSEHNLTRGYRQD